MTSPSGLPKLLARSFSRPLNELPFRFGGGGIELLRVIVVASVFDIIDQRGAEASVAM